MKFKLFKLAAIGALACLLACLTSCFSMNDHAKRQRQWLDNPNGMRVLCTTEMIQALVEAIGGEYVDTLAIIYGELDPHSYQLVKGDDEKIAKAEAIFCNGLGLEHGPSLHAALSQHPRAFHLGDELAQTDPELVIMHGPSADPHIWLDVGLFAKLCPLIGQHLSQIDPKHAQEYLKKAQVVQSKLEGIHADLKARFEEVVPEKRYLVTSHEAFFYLARAYLATDEELDDDNAWRSRFCAPEGLAPESQISLKRIMEIVEYIKDHQVKAAFLEVNVNSDAVYKIQQVLSAQDYPLAIPQQPLYSDSMPQVSNEIMPKAYERYMEMIESNAKVILSAWGSADGS